MNWELFIFVIFAVTAVAGAFALIGARNPVYSAMGLLTTMFSIAVSRSRFFCIRVEILGEADSGKTCR